MIEWMKLQVLLTATETASTVIDEDEIKIIQTFLNGNPIYSFDNISIIANWFLECVKSISLKWKGFLGKTHVHCIIVKMD